MNKTKSDPKVKKTLVRNCETKLDIPSKVVHEVDFNDKSTKSSGSRENKLDQPTLCSSEALANYLLDVKVSASQHSATENLNVDKGPNSAKLTKKLNFHINDKIYRNLIELNANEDDLRKKKDKRSLSGQSTKRDAEPNIDDFYEEIIDNDIVPTIPIPKPKYKPVKITENGNLHKLVAAFEYL